MASLRHRPRQRTALRAATFDTKMDAEAWLTDERRIIASGAWVAPAERQRQQVTAMTFEAMRRLGWPTGRSSRAPGSTTGRCLIGRSCRALVTSRSKPRHRPRSAPGTRARDEDTDAAGPRLRAAADDSRDRGPRRTDPANPCHIRGAGNSKRVHKIKPLDPARARGAGREHAGAAPADGAARRLVRPAVRRADRTTPQRRRPEEWAHSRPARRRPCRRRAVVGTPKSDAGVRDVAIPPHLLPIVKAAHR